jgi:hypothetical protein
MIQKVKVGKEIVITAKNKVGLLSSISKVLADHGINIIAVSAQAAGGVALLNFVVDEHVRAMDTLRKNGYQATENDVVLVELEDRPGALRQLTQKLAAKKIDLMNIYGSTTAAYSPCLLVVSSNNNQKAIVTLRKP